MKEYTILNRSLVSFEDGDIKTAVSEHYQYEIDDYWIIREDGILYFEGKEYEVKKGDIVFVMYPFKREEKPERPIIIANIPEIIHYYEMKDLYTETVANCEKKNTNKCQCDCGR